MTYGASLNTPDVSVTNESYNSLPDLEEIVQTAQQLQQQSTPIHNPQRQGNGNSATQQPTDETTAAASSNNTDQPSSAATVTPNNNGSTE